MPDTGTGSAGERPTLARIRTWWRTWMARAAAIPRTAWDELDSAIRNDEERRVLETLVVHYLAASENPPGWILPYGAVCGCGYRGPSRLTRLAAVEDWVEHVRALVFTTRVENPLGVEAR